MTAVTSTVTLDTPAPTTARARGGGLAAVATLARRRFAISARTPRGLDAADRRRSGVQPRPAPARESEHHFCRTDPAGQPCCTCGWSEHGHFDSGGSRAAEIDHLISVGAHWADAIGSQR
jgi:hypothetical protein